MRRGCPPLQAFQRSLAGGITSPSGAEVRSARNWTGVRNKLTGSSAAATRRWSAGSPVSWARVISSSGAWSAVFTRRPVSPPLNGRDGSFSIPVSVSWLLLDREMVAMERKERLAWTALIVGALLLRLVALGARPPHHDEAVHCDFAYNLLHAGTYQYDPTYHGPLLFYVM